MSTEIKHENPGVLLVPGSHPDILTYMDSQYRDLHEVAHSLLYIDLAGNTRFPTLYFTVSPVCIHENVAYHNKIDSSDRFWATCYMLEDLPWDIHIYAVIRGIVDERRHSKISAELMIYICIVKTKAIWCGLFCVEKEPMIKATAFLGKARNAWRVNRAFFPVRFF